VQAEFDRDSIRYGLVAMLPRLKRFADVLVGDRHEGRALLGRALGRMLAEQHRYQRGTALDRWAFAEIYRLWMRELREETVPLPRARGIDMGFEQLFHSEGESLDDVTVGYLANLPPQQRSTLLLVYGEGFDHEDAGRVLDATPEAIAARMIRASANFADRLGSDAPLPVSATIERLYPQDPQGSQDHEGPS
jgi:RNA polymerase sigma-70 factor (ECF subfamily)